MKWEMECERFPLKPEEQESIIMSLHTAAMMANHDAARVKKKDAELDQKKYRDSIELAVVSGLEQTAAVLDSLYMVIESTNQLDKFESCRAYILEAMRLMAVETGYELRILSCIATGTRSDPNVVRKVYEIEQRRLNNLDGPCECPLCCIMSIMDFSGCANGGPKASEGMKLLHEHIKGKSAFEDLLDSLG